jgi:ParB family transcriptional regulator, chromosome partitioning protein
MSENKRRGLGRGLGALIPTGTPATRPAGDRPVDVFFPERAEEGSVATVTREETDGEQSATQSPQPVEARNTVAAAPVAPPTARDARQETSKPVTGPPSNNPIRIPTAAPVKLAPAGPVGTSAPPAEAVAAPVVDRSTKEVELVPVPGARFEELPVDSIVPNPRQPRTVFDQDAMAELVHSVREIGVLQPVVVRPAGGSADNPRFELIMGERRWRATQAAGLDRIPAIIRETGDDALLRDALLENLHRSELNPLEEAAAYQQLLEDFGCTHEELATRIGRSRPQISNTIRLLRLPPQVQRRVAAGVLSAGHARALLGLDDHEAMDRLAQRIVAEGLSVRATEETVALNDSSGTPAPRKRPRPGNHHGELDDLAARLADRLDTRVSVALGRAKGKLGIEFASVEDLNRILDILVPNLRGAFQPE